ncbi:MAG: 3-hydroxyacyl-CoA dehydrogenase family protein [Boseongicola sp. SB0667_bin_21]|nr:3-hydroxyacyl-CoA dehydrogenase family protein [Boseongicola sp. SB0667_bin_21]
MAGSSISTVAVVGFGTMGQGIAQNFAEAGLDVRVVDRDTEVLARGQAQILANLRVAEGHGLVQDPASVAARIASYSEDDLRQALEGAELVIESVPEILDVKKEVFARLDDLPEDVLIGSNTSSFTVSQLTERMVTAARVVGVHYFNPAHVIPAVEIHHGSDTSATAIEQMIAIMDDVGKVPVRVRKEIPGFIINRLTGALEREIDLLLDEGIVSPRDLDAAVKASLGFRLACIGPMEAEDFIGLDTAYRVSNNVYKGLSNATEASAALGEKVERGELGVKSGKGWYDYTGIPLAETFAKRDKKLLAQLALYRAAQNSEG